MVFDENGIKKLDEMKSSEEVHVGGLYVNKEGSESLVEYVVTNTERNDVFCISRPKGFVTVIPKGLFLEDFKYTGEDYSNEIGVILGTLPF